MSKKHRKQWFRPALTILSRDMSRDNATSVLATCKRGSGAGWVSITVDYGACVYGYSMLCATCDKQAAS